MFKVNSKTPSKMPIRHYDNTYNDFTYNDNTIVIISMSPIVGGITDFTYK